MPHPAATLFKVIQKIEEWLLAGGILAIAALTIINVLTRTITGTSLAFAEELSQFLIVLVTFVGIGYGASQGRHIRMTAVYDQLGVRGRKVMMLLIAGTTSLLMFALTWFALSYVGTVRALGSASPVLGVPLYLVYAAAPLGLFLGGIQYALAVVKNLREEEVYLSFEKKDEYDEPQEGGL